MSVPRLRVRRPKLPRITQNTISDRMYNCSRWRNLSRWYRQTHPVCERCGEQLTDEVHHVVPIRVAPARAYDASNLVGLCRGCHRAEHADTRLCFGRRPKGGHTPPIVEAGGPHT